MRIFSGLTGAGPAQSDGRLLIFGSPNDLPYPHWIFRVAENRQRRSAEPLEAAAAARGLPALPSGTACRIDLVAIPHGGDKPELKSLLRSLPELANKVAQKLNLLKS